MMRSRRAPAISRRRFLALGGGLAAAALVGCDDPGEAVPRTTPTAPVEEEAAATIPLRPRGPLPQQAMGVLRLGTLLPSPGHTFAAEEEPLIYSRLVAVDPRSPAVHADLAEAVELVEPLLLRITLRPEVFFHGDAGGLAHPLTAEVVVRNFERRAAENVYLFREVIDRIEAPDPVTVLLRLRAPFALLFDLLARADAAIRGDTVYPTFQAPVGSGAFVPLGRQSWGHSYVANPSWYGGTPGVSQLAALSAADDEELDDLFTSGDTDLRVHPDAASREAADAREDVRRLSRPSRRLRGLGLSMLGRKDGQAVRHVPQFQDERVRRAVSLALDRAALNALDDAMLSGPVGPAHASDALPPIELQAHPLLAHDPAEARELLIAAEAEGLEFRIHHQDTPGTLVLARMVAEQLGEAGFAARRETVPSAEWDDQFQRGDFEAAMFELATMETADLGLRLHTSGGLTGRASLWGYSDPVYDAAVREALSAIDPAKRARRSREAQRLLLDRVPAMFPLAAPLEHASTSPDLQGYAFDAYEFNAGYLAPSWTLSR